jgi:hypothetical protein
MFDAGTLPKSVEATVSQTLGPAQPDASIFSVYKLQKMFFLSFLFLPVLLSVKFAQLYRITKDYIQTKQS